MNEAITNAGPVDRNAALWDLWRRLVKLFPTWSLLPSGLYTPGAWGYLGVDFLSGFRRNRSTNQAFDLLADVDDPTFDALSSLAALNARRQDQMLKVVIVGYLTIPAAILAIVADVAGDSMMSFAREHMTAVIQVGTLVTLGPLGYLLGQWRSRQIVGVLDMIRIERGGVPFGTPEPGDDG